MFLFAQQDGLDVVFADAFDLVGWQLAELLGGERAVVYRMELLKRMITHNASNYFVILFEFNVDNNTLIDNN